MTCDSNIIRCSSLQPLMAQMLQTHRSKPLLVEPVEGVSICWMLWQSLNCTSLSFTFFNEFYIKL